MVRALLLYRGGTLQAGGSDRTLANIISVLAPSTIDNDGNTFTLQNSLVGSGHLTFDGTGTTVLSRTSGGFSGGATVTSGTLALNAVGGAPLGTSGTLSLTGTLTNSATLDIQQTLTFPNSLSFSGVNTLKMSHGLIVIPPNNSFTNSGILNVVQGLDGTYVRTAGGFINTGQITNNHVMRLSLGSIGSNTGTIINDSPYPLDLNWLDQNGSRFLIGGATFNNAGTFNNISSLSVNASLNTSTLVLTPGIFNINAGSVLQSTGFITLAGGTIAANTTITLPWQVRLLNPFPNDNIPFENIIQASAGNTLTIDNTILDSRGAGNAIYISPLELKGPGSFVISGNNTYTCGTVIGETNSPTMVTTGSNTAFGVGDVTLLGGSTIHPFAGNLQLASTQTLKGSGTIAGSIANNGGTIAAGTDTNPYDMLTLGGNYSGSGTVKVAIRPSTNPVAGVDYNVLDLGAANFDASNTSLSLVPENGVYTTGAKYQFITTTGQVNGTFLNDQSLPALGAYRPVISYNANAGGGAALTVEVEMSRIYLTTALGGKADAQSYPAAAYLDSQPNPNLDSPLGSLIGQLDDLSGSDLDRALDSFVPEETDDATYLLHQSPQKAHTIHQARVMAQRSAARSGGLGSGATFASTVSGRQHYNQKILNSLRANDPSSIEMRALNSTKASFKSDVKEAMQNSVAETMGRGGYWTHAYGSLTRQNNSGDDKGFKAQTGGILVGGDVKLSPNTFFGVSGGFTKTLMKMNDNGGTHHLDSYMMSVYGTWFDGPFALDYALTGSLNVYNLVRRVIIAPNPANDVASMHNGYEISPYLGLSYEFNVNDIQITPFATGSFSAVRERGYRETGGVIDQQVHARNSYFLTTELGLTVSHDIAFDEKVFTPSLKLGYIYKKPTKSGAIVASFAGASGTYSVTSTNKAVNEFAPSLEGTIRWKNGLYVGASYSAELSKDYRVHELTLKLGKRF